LFLSRFISFHATNDWKVLAGSTPTIDGGSKIDELYQAGDQRRWHIDCPNCGTAIPLDFKHLQFNRRPPHAAHYAAQCCGGIIEHLSKGGVGPRRPLRRRQSDRALSEFHVDALISQLTTWDKIAEKAIAAEGDERKMMTFHNNWLGLPYAVKGDAPDWQRLFERREDYAENTVPPLGLLLVAGADVQHSGIWLEVVAFAPDRQSWTVSARFLAGDTTDPNLGAFAELARVYDEAFVDAWGNKRRKSILTIDAGDGGRSNQVYAFARHRMRAIAVKGVAGWTAPAIAGQPTRVHGQPRRASACRAAARCGRSAPGRSRRSFTTTCARMAARRAASSTRRALRTTARSSPRRISARSPPSRSKTKVVKGRTVRAWVEHGAEPLSRLPHLRDGGGRAARPHPQDARAMARAGASLSMPVDAGDLFAPAECSPSSARCRPTPRPPRSTSPPSSSARSPASRSAGRTGAAAC
jgi:hypothetical protein